MSPEYWDRYAGGALAADDDPVTGLDGGEIGALTAALTTAPEGFHVHPKVAKLLEQRAEMGQGKRPIDLWVRRAAGVCGGCCRRGRRCG